MPENSGIDYARMLLFAFFFCFLENYAKFSRLPARQRGRVNNVGKKVTSEKTNFMVSFQ